MQARLAPAEAGDEIRTGEWAARFGLLLGVVLAMLAVAYVLFTNERRNPLLGTWVGHDPAAGQVVYYFGPEGHGYRIVGGEMQQLRHSLDEGYPNLIRIQIANGRDSFAYNGLVELKSDSELLLELAPPGQRAPRQLTGAALEFRRAASR